MKTRCSTPLALLCMVAVMADAGTEDVLRLGRDVVPTAQEVHWVMDPESDGFCGSTVIDVTVVERTEIIRFHARNMNSLSLSVSRGGQLVEGSHTIGDKGTVTWRATRPCEPGAYRLSMDFETAFNQTGVGVYKVDSNGRSYVFTQMEPEYAREGVPCFDAPEFKIPWRVSITAPEGCEVIANMAIQASEPAGDQVRHIFEPTPPMPSYLLALVVGPGLDTIPVPGMSAPGRIVAIGDQIRLAGEAVRITPPLLAALEAYFDQPYPYSKLDQIAVPEFNYGAMENVGAVTYRDTILLRDPQALTHAQAQRLALTVAHELSHMWFGNLVTPKWWDDLWLNESFASWIAQKMVDETFPEYDIGNHDLGSREWAMGSDELSSSRPIRRPISAGDEMHHLFDSLAYSKGMAVLNMVEDWLGAPAFRTGMIRYMQDHAWKNADAFDLAKSLASIDRLDLDSVMRSFVTQAGVPLLRFRHAGGGRYRVSQTRYGQIGEQYPVSRWSIPVVIAWSDGRDLHSHRTLISDTETELDLGPKADALVWMYPNASEKGYYRWMLSPADMQALGRAASELSVRQRLGFIKNARAMLLAGELESTAYLELLEAFRTDADPEVLTAVIDALDGVLVELIPDARSDSYRAWLRSSLRPAMERVGFEKRPDEPVAEEALRRRLIEVLGGQARDPEVLERAGLEAERFMEDSSQVEASLAGTWLNLAARQGDERLFDRYQQRFETESVPTRKEYFLNALSGFDDPALRRRALAYTLSDAVPPHQFGSIPFGLCRTDANRKEVLDWLDREFDRIAGKVAAPSLSYFPWMACGQSRELLDQAQAIFLAEGRTSQALEREVEQVRNVLTTRFRLKSKIEAEQPWFLVDPGASDPDAANPPPGGA